MELEKKEVQQTEAGAAGQGGAIGKAQIQKATEILAEYKKGKETLEKKIIENEKWYRLRHWETTSNTEINNIQPKSAWLFNALLNKHGDAMDNYPEPNFLPREQDDEAEADILTKVVPVVLERNFFEDTYSAAWWYKIKNGVAAYGVFWDNNLENGLGDINIRKIDILKLYWEPSVEDIQDSSNLFVLDMVADETIRESYPTYQGKEEKAIELSKYAQDDDSKDTGKSVVVDWYYKKAGKLHFCKYVGDTVLYATENDPLYSQSGWYEHGQYPIVIDQCFPLEGQVAGFGFVDIAKDTQMYIDKLQQLIIKNAYMAGRKRFFVRNEGSVDKEAFADWSQDFVRCDDINDISIKEINVSPIPPFVMEQMQFKIDEMKETTGNRDFSQGGTAGGVTSGAAIAALQESGNKLSRDLIKGSYRAYSEICNLCIELIRQFYTEERSFRIDDPNGTYQFVNYSNEGLMQEIPQEAVVGENGMVEQQEAIYRKSVFDIKIKPQRANPYSRMAQNELANALYAAGFFNPQMADQALIALEIMDFEGKEKIKQLIQEGQQQMMMQQQQAMQQQAMMQQLPPTM